MTYQGLYWHERHQKMTEPERGSIAVGYVCYGFQLPEPVSIEEQKQRIMEFAEKKGWKVSGWYEEPEQSAVSKDIEKRPALTQLFRDAPTQFQVVLCFAASYWGRTIAAYEHFHQLQQLQVWWATADGRWDTNRVWSDGMDTTCIPHSHSSRVRRKSTSQRRQKGRN